MELKEKLKYAIKFYQTLLFKTNESNVESINYYMGKIHAFETILQYLNGEPTMLDDLVISAFEDGEE